MIRKRILDQLNYNEQFDLHADFQHHDFFNNILETRSADATDKKEISMIHNQGLHCTTSKMLTSFALLMLLLTIFASLAASQSDSSNSAFAIQADLPKAAIYGLFINISIPDGMTFDSASLDISGASTTASVTTSPAEGSSGDAIVTLDFGKVDNSADQDILVRFKALVANIEDVKNGLVLPPVTASLQYRDADGGLHQFSGSMDPVTVVEPDFLIRRSFAPTGGWHGDTVTCSIFVSHSSVSTADAYDVDLQESLPASLSYVPDSMKMVKGPADGSLDNSGGPSWHISRLNQSWKDTNEIELQYQATIDGRVHSNALLKCNAALAWTSTPGENPSERSYSKTSSDRVMLNSPPPDFNLIMADYPTTVSPGGTLTYTISYRNRGGDATGPAIQASYDANTAFVSADPAPDAGTTDRWTLGEDGLLATNASGSIKITLQVKNDLADGTILAGHATLSCDQGAGVAGASAQDSVFTKVLASTPSLLIEKTASDEVIRPGGTLDYEITFENSGTEDATNVTVTDVVDANLLFDPKSSDPKPSLVWQEKDGTHLFWNSTALSAALSSGKLEPGKSGIIRFQVSLPSVPQHPAYDWVYNNYKIDCDERSGKFKTLQTAVIHSLYIRKSVESKSYGTGELVNYTLNYGNDLAVDLVETNIIDILPDSKYMEFYYADPAPSSVQGNVITWNIGSLPAKASGKISLYASTVYNRSTINYHSIGSVSGQGFVSFDQRLDTAQEPRCLTNNANITARVASNHDIVERDSSSASFLLSESFGTALTISGHGSGSYTREEESSLRSRNKTIRSRTTLNEEYQGTSFSLPGGRNLSYSSKWSESQSAKNRITGATMSESYRYASRINRNSEVLLDKNGSTLDSETSFEGKGHVGLQKWASDSSSAGNGTGSSLSTTRYNGQEIAAHSLGSPAFLSQEDYTGSFRVITHFDEYGKNAEATRSVQGQGYAASDKRMGKDQGSHESGSGNYSAEDQFQTASSYLKKDINVSSNAVSYNYTPDTRLELDQKWSEGTWTRSGPYYPGSSKAGSLKGYATGIDNETRSLISEKFSSLDYLNKNTTVSGLGSMKTQASFKGKGEFKVQLNRAANNSNLSSIDIDQEYTGKYDIQRNTELSGIARYNEPHISVSKYGKVRTTGGSLVDYVITVTNDGNRVLGPVYVQDIFPQGSEYIYSSLRPASQNASRASWTLLSLGIGSSTIIDLSLNATDSSGSLINRVQADGGYNGQWVSAQNYSVLDSSWLSCCPPQIRADMIAQADRLDPSMIRYRIILKNRAEYTMTATITDDLGPGLAFLNSSIEPARYSPSQAIWNIIDLKEGENRTIDLLARTSHEGSFLSQVHIESHALDGSGEAQADLAVRVDTGSTVQDFQSSDWRPPACFGLNYSQPIYGDASGGEWMPCEACALNEPGSSFDSCTSCTGASSGDGYDIP
jgi:uncharacterized repeat protein (TIGR01451 family)